MIRLLAPGLAVLIGVVLWVYAVFDVHRTDEALTRKLPKPLWLLVVLLLPPIGPVAWLIVGRPLYTGFAPGGTQHRPSPRFIPPEDRPEFGSGPAPRGPSAEQLRRWEQDLAGREDELGDPDDDAPPGREGPDRTA